MAYQWLDPTRDQIRLLTILPELSYSDTINEPKGLLHCRLETVSLSDWSPTYQAFRKQADYARATQKRRDAQDWYSFQCSSDDQRGSVRSPLIPQAPNSNLYRFLWGDYAALSYTWGDPSRTRAIYLNDQLKHITQNLEAALRSFSRTDMFKHSYRLWVDALCINQEDTEERNREVGRMRDIYGQSWNVVIWLGEEAEDSGKAMDVIAALAKSYGSPETMDQIFGILRLKPDFLGNGGWQGVHQLLHRSYWERVWILQEIWSGGELMPIYCGERQMSWETFHHGLEVILQGTQDVNNLIFRDRERVGNQDRGLAWGVLVRSIRDLQSLVSGNQDSLPLTRLIALSRLSKCSIEVDHVYGMLGMADSLVASNVAADYRKSTVKTYAEFAKSYIIGSRSLELLLECENPVQSDFPSWVPNWANWIRRLPRPEVPYQAGGNCAISPHFSEDIGLLTTKGILVDTVDGLAAWLSPEDPMVQPLFNSNAYATDEATEDAFWRTLIADRDKWGKKAGIENQSLLKFPLNFGSEGRFRKNTILGREIAERWLTWRDTNGTFMTNGRRVDSFMDTMTLTSSNYLVGDFEDACERFHDVMYWQRFMTTEKGRFGWAPGQRSPSPSMNVARQGDVICILLSCSAPLIIRPKESSYKLIGPCYVQGIMEGEALEQIKTGEVQLQYITLC